MYNHRGMSNLTSDKKNNGFTLLEVLVAIVILTAGLLGMASLTGTIIHGNKLSNDLTTATTLAQDKMEDIRRLGYSSMPATDTTTTENYNSITGYAAHKRVTVTDVYTSGTTWPQSGMKAITVTVYWDSDRHSVELKTSLAQ